MDNDQFKAQPKPSLAQRVAEREDRSKPLYMGVHLIHRPTGFGYVVDGHAEAFDQPSVQLVILRRSRIIYDTLYVIPIEEVKDEEVWSYVGL